MAELIITTEAFMIGVGTITEALSISLVIVTVGASVALTLYVLLKYTEKDITIHVQTQDQFPISKELRG